MSQQPSLEDVRRVKSQVESDLLSRPGVTGVDIGTKTVNGVPTGQPAIIVYVNKKGGVPANEMIPKDIQGVPTDVVERSFELH